MLLRNTDNCCRNCPCHPALAFSPNGLSLASASFDTDVKLWDVESGSERTVLKGHTNAVVAVYFGPYGNILATGSADKSVKIWDLKTEITLHTLTSHVGEVMAVVVSRDGRLLVSGSGNNDFGEIKVWDIASDESELLRTFRGHTKIITALALGDDARMLVASAMDHSVKLWNLQDGKLFKDLTIHIGTALVANKPVAMTGDCRVIVSGGPDDTLQIWHLAAGSVMTGAIGQITTVALNHK